MVQVVQVVQVWAEPLHNTEPHAILEDGFAQVREPRVEIVEAYRNAGMTRAVIAALSVVRTMTALAQGFAAWYALFGDVPVQVVGPGVKALTSMGYQAARDRAGHLRGSRRLTSAGSGGG